MPASRTSPRRNNAPVRPRKPATTVPDFLIACAGMTFAMAAAIAAATLAPGDLINGDTGRALARVFSGLLVAASVLLMLMALLLLRGERGRGDHYWWPLLIGATAGVLEAWFFLAEWGNLLWIPPILLLLSLRPVRRIAGSMFGAGGPR